MIPNFEKVLAFHGTQFSIKCTMLGYLVSPFRHILYLLIFSEGIFLDKPFIVYFQVAIYWTSQML